MYKKEYWEADLKRWGKIEEENIVVCPYCFAERELHPDEFDNEEWEDEEECELCGKYYKVEAEVRFTFWATTKKKEE